MFKVAFKDVTIREAAFFHRASKTLVVRPQARLAASKSCSSVFVCASLTFIEPQGVQLTG
jgi:hypothetical protein